MRGEVKARFCNALQRVTEVLAERFVELVEEERFVEAGGILRDIDLIATVMDKLKCGEEEG